MMKEGVIFLNQILSLKQLATPTLLPGPKPEIGSLSCDCPLGQQFQLAMVHPPKYVNTGCKMVKPRLPPLFSIPKK
jgi:hypothetical protein